MTGICETKFEDEQNRLTGSGDMVKLRCLRGFLRKTKDADEEYYREFYYGQYCLWDGSARSPF